MRNQDREGCLGAIGKVDGTDIVLQYKPGGVFHGEHFYTRKKRYSIDLCAVCDSRKRFLYSMEDFRFSCESFSGSGTAFVDLFFRGIIL